MFVLKDFDLSIVICLTLVGTTMFLYCALSRSVAVMKCTRKEILKINL